MKSASLPELPKGREFEEYAAAVFQASGLFVEQNLTEREEVEILQLDAITTDYDEHPPLLRLVEAKSGEWGFRDVFKIKGQMTYLGIPRASLITSEERERIDKYKRLATRVGVDLTLVKELARYKEEFTQLLKGKDVDERDVWIWRFCYWAERQLLARVHTQMKTQSGASRFAAILDYAFQINSGVFFNETVAERVEALYETYTQFRALAARCGHEIKGGDFKSADDRMPLDIFRRSFYQCALNEVQTACMLEQQARLTLLKAAVDYLSCKADGQVSLAEKTITWSHEGKEITIPLVTFPDRFEKALDEIVNEPSFRRYPVFWQWFLGAFGGFILMDHEEEEYALLSAKTGVPLEEVPLAFAAWDKLFPIERGWFRDQAQSNIRVLILYPIPIRGIGANYRRVIYTSDHTYETLQLEGRFTRNDLLKWNNAAVELLSQ